MGAIYGGKIRRDEINPKTGKAWTFEDVPAFWKKKTEYWMKTN